MKLIVQLKSACLQSSLRTVRRKSQTNGITRAHALNGDGSVTCTLTFQDEATFDNGMVQHPDPNLESLAN